MLIIFSKLLMLIFVFLFFLVVLRIKCFLSFVPGDELTRRVRCTLRSGKRVYSFLKKISLHPGLGQSTVTFTTGDIASCTLRLEPYLFAVFIMMLPTSK